MGLLNCVKRVCGHKRSSVPSCGEGTRLVQVMPSARTLRVGPLVRQRLEVVDEVRIRFQRKGRKKLPFFRLVATDSREARNANPLEFLGWYNPLTKETSLKAPQIKKWLDTGAQPTETVKRLLEKALIMEPKAKAAVK